MNYFRSLYFSWLLCSFLLEFKGMQYFNCNYANIYLEALLLFLSSKKFSLPRKAGLYFFSFQTELVMCILVYQILMALGLWNGKYSWCIKKHDTYPMILITQWMLSSVGKQDLEGHVRWCNCNCDYALCFLLFLISYYAHVNFKNISTEVPTLVGKILWPPRQGLCT